MPRRIFCRAISTKLVGMLLLFTMLAQEAGAIKFTKPDLPAPAMGASIDNLLSLPGYCFPLTCLPPGDSTIDEGDNLAETPGYPAAVLSFRDISDHSPVLLAIPFDPEDEVAVQRRRIRVGHLTGEVWSVRDGELALALFRRLST